MEFESLTEKIIGSAYQVYNKMGYGFLESGYEKCMLIELRKAGLKSDYQKPITVRYDRKVVGQFVADIFVEDTIIVELSPSCLKKQFLTKSKRESMSRR